jgi:hypothetical protein
MFAALVILSGCTSSANYGDSEVITVTKLATKITQFYIKTKKWPEIENDFATDNAAISISEVFSTLTYKTENARFLVNAQVSGSNQFWEIEFIPTEADDGVNFNMHTKATVVVGSKVKSSFSEILFKSAICTMLGEGPNECNT